MNYTPRSAALVACNESDAAFAESAISSSGLTVTRFDSIATLANQLQSDAITSESAAMPDVAIVTGSTSELDDELIVSLSGYVPVVVTTTAATVYDAVELMKHGVKDVIVLPCSREEFWKRLSHTLASSGEEKACKAMQTEMRNRFDTLTQAELDVVDAMLDGLANKQIAQRLGIGLRTVELRRSKIMRKMKARSVAELVKLICISGALAASHTTVST